MKGDFSRVSFDPTRAARFSRVLMQQGRVFTDADWNEQASIHLHMLRTLASDLIGPHGGPRGEAFAITASDPEGTALDDDLWIGAGHYYVDGWLAESRGRPWRPQAAFEERGFDLDDPDRRFLAYLDVWERHVSSVEADGAVELDLRDPILLRELALGGPDTASRAEVSWRVRLLDLDVLRNELDGFPDVGSVAAWFADDDNLGEWRAWLRGATPGRMSAMARTGDGASAEPCVLPPESRYRGLENQLYRIEIHDPGPAFDPEADGEGVRTATFKWSRDNGCVVLPIARIDGEYLMLAHWWRDRRSGLEVGQWVEVGDDGDLTTTDPATNVLRRVADVDPDRMRIKLDAAPHLAQAKRELHPWVRRWDHGRRLSENAAFGEMGPSNALRIVEGEDAWIELEDGVRIRFEPASTDATEDVRHVYRRGDYWLVPARTAIGDVVWPRTAEVEPDGGVRYEPTALAPHGVEHHYAPLAVTTDGGATLEDLRRTIAPVAG